MKAAKTDERTISIIFPVLFLMAKASRIGVIPPTTERPMERYLVEAIQLSGSRYSIKLIKKVADA